MPKVTEQELDSLLSQIAAGKSLRSQLDKLGIHYEQFYRQLDMDEALRERYTRARKHQAESGQARILECVDRVLSDDLDPNAARVAIDALKWNAARMHPAIYGEKIAHTGADGTGPIQVVVHRGQKPDAGH